jgi:hypothetical protein
VPQEDRLALEHLAAEGRAIYALMYRNPWVSGHLRLHPTLPGNGPTQENTTFSWISHILTTLLQAPPHLAENLTRAGTSPIYDICTEAVWYLQAVCSCQEN